VKRNRLLHQIADDNTFVHRRRLSAAKGSLISKFAVVRHNALEIAMRVRRDPGAMVGALKRRLKRSRQ
jgi:hypothetical protein